MEKKRRTAIIDEMMATVHTRQSTTFTLSTMAVKLLPTIKLAAPPSNLEEYYSTTTICIVATDH